MFYIWWQLQQDAEYYLVVTSALPNLEFRAPRVWGLGSTAFCLGKPTPSTLSIDAWPEEKWQEDVDGAVYSDLRLRDVPRNMVRPFASKTKLAFHC